MIQTDRETFQMMLHQIMERFDRIEDRLSRMNRQTSALDGDKLLDNQDMCELRKHSKKYPLPRLGFDCSFALTITITP